MYGYDNMGSNIGRYDYFPMNDSGPYAPSNPNLPINALPPIMKMPQANIYIRKLFIIPTRDNYKQVYRRPYVVDANRETLNKFGNMLDMYGRTRTLERANVANIIPEAIKIAAMPTGKADIPNGWNTQRGRFIMEVVYDYNGTKVLTYIQGYTDFLDFTHNGILAPDMIFYINSITVVSQAVDPQNNALFNMKRQIFNVIKDHTGKYDFREIENFINAPTLCRPVDVMQDLYSSETVMKNADTRVVNTTNYLGGNTALSKRLNNDPSTFFTNTLNGFIDAKASTLISTNQEDVYKGATSSVFVSEPILIDNEFIKALYKVTNEIAPTTFSLSTLKLIDPNVEQVTTLISKPDLGMGITGTTDTGDLLSPTPEALKATMVSNTLNSLLVDNMLSRLDISISNKNDITMPAIIPTNINSFIEGVDLIKECDRVISQIRTLLLPFITDGNQTVVDVIASTDIFGDTTIAISLNNQPAQIFRFPTFADSLYSPIVSSTNAKNAMVHDFSNFMDATYGQADFM